MRHCIFECAASPLTRTGFCAVSPPKDKTGDRDDNQQDRRDGHQISHPSEQMRPSPVLYLWRVRAFAAGLATPVPTAKRSSGALWLLFHCDRNAMASTTSHPTMTIETN